ncbi:acetate/propionate family kinase [Pseudorhodobacter aquimaris]|uniref:acetate/propionate family kinase n=1 Tax=Pseudorhodobacter aquimaris TaxID=687412 RepID=UPI00067AEEB1|nr:acetate/propionate family kinase [Pseudorhodobacter aquimaris]
MSEVFLTLNAGSSSIKFAVYDAHDPSPTPRLGGKIAGIGSAPVFAARDASGAAVDKGALAALDQDASHDALIALLLPWIAAHQNGAAPLAVGHRVVHGGQDFIAPTVVDEAILTQLETLNPLAPLHQPHNLGAIRAVANLYPDIPQIACFDTAFHHTQDRLAKLFALPRDLTDQGIIRYGFHGLSYDYIASTLPEHLPGARRVVVAHLGNGASMCAMRDGQSMATSMGFTALDGLMMGRRCGALDPGVILYLMQSEGMDPEAIKDLLYNQSGLYGVSQISNDMQILQEANTPEAEEAIALYCYRAAGVLAGLLPAIGGLDALVFTAGIGENAPLVRRKICEHLRWLGVAIDSAANASNATTISTLQSQVSVLVIPTNEEAVVVNACRALVL